MQLRRSFCLMIFLGLAVLAFAGCLCGALFGSFAPMSSSPTASPPEQRAWVVCYTDGDWEQEAAVSLAARLGEACGLPFTVLPYSEGLAGENRILLGWTGDSADYFARLEELGQNGWAIARGEDGVVLNAFSLAGAEDACAALLAETEALMDGTLTDRVCIARVGSEADSTVLESKIPLRLREDGSFRLAIFSDISAGAALSPYTVSALDAIVAKEAPDLVLFAGGTADGFSTAVELREYLTTLTAPLETRGIPWAHLYTGGDVLARRVADEVYASFAHCISKAGDYLLPVFDGDRLCFGVWMMSLPEEGAPGCYTPAQVADFSAAAGAAAQAAGGSLSAVMVLGLPLPEFAQAAASPTSGEIGEAITIPALNNGLFAAAQAAGVRAIYAGGDHLNSYAGTYYDVELGALASLGYDGYGFGGSFDTNNRLRGGRIVEITPSTITSRMIYAADLGVGR